MKKKSHEKEFSFKTFTTQHKGLEKVIIITAVKKIDFIIKIVLHTKKLNKILHTFWNIYVFNITYKKLKSKI